MWNFRLKSFLGGLKDEEERLPVLRKGCDAPGCPELGEYKAPKSRTGIRDYYWFCLDHVREYNQNWDYFKGMSADEVEDHMRKAIVGDRPTWRATQAGQNEERLRAKIYARFKNGESVFSEFSMGGDRDDEEEKPRINAGLAAVSHPTLEALTVMGMVPPVVWEDIRKQYKTLAKKYHPDTNNNDPAAEEQLKKINMAYTILKLSYQTYTDIKGK